MLKLFVMIDVTTMTNISWRSQYTFLNIRMCIRQMMLTISPVAAGTIKHRSAITLSPSGCIKNNGYREVF